MLEEYEYSYINRLAYNKEQVEVLMENFSMSKLFIAFLLCGVLLGAGCSKNNDTGTNSDHVGEQMTLDHVDVFPEMATFRPMYQSRSTYD